MAALIHQSRVKISKLENGHGRPDLSDVMEILRALEVPDSQWRPIMELATDAAHKGWWDRYGDTMGELQRVYCDLESSCDTVSEYQPGILPGLVQTLEYTEALVDNDLALGALDYVPARALEARQQRQRVASGEDGPHINFILDEVGLRRYAVPAAVMSEALRHVVRLVESHPRLSVRVLPLATGQVMDRLPRSQFLLFTFPDPMDPRLVSVATDSTHLFLTEPDKVELYARKWTYLQTLALSEVGSLTMLSELATEIGNEQDSG